MFEYLQELWDEWFGDDDEPIAPTPTADPDPNDTNDPGGNDDTDPTDGPMTYAARRGSNHDPEATCATCGLSSLRFHIGWAFHPNEVPAGTVQLLPGMPTAQPIPADGHVVLDTASGFGIPAGTQFSTLVIAVTDGPTYRFRVHFDLPGIHEPTGLKRRLTNLGLYAGIDEYFGGRALWAVRAFKRMYMNDYERNSTAEENDHVDGTNALNLTSAFLTEVQTAHGAHPDDVVADLAVPETLINRGATEIANANMFLGQTLTRASYETAGAANDRDPNPTNSRAVWGGVENPEVDATATGYELCLGVYQEDEGEAPIENKVCLPQPVHMLQFALFETGYWLVAGGRSSGQTISQFGPAATVGATDAANGVFASLDGDYGRSTHWAVREFQCHAKMDQAAVEDVTVTEPLYIQRLITLDPVETAGRARYALDGRVSGSVNDNTARAIQDWLDRRYRCPVVIYAAPNATYLQPQTFVSENIWRYDDLPSPTPRMFAIDLSENYDIPAQYRVDQIIDGQTVKRPITVGEYIPYRQSGITYGGPQTVVRHLWNLETTEVTPQTVFGRGGLNGDGLTAAELSTFKVIKAAAIFECLGHYDALNSYDRVTLSYGLCHWTLAAIGGDTAQSAWEMGGLFSFLQANHNAAFNEAFGRYGVSATRTWPFASTVSGKWASTVQMQTETGDVILCGDGNDYEENKYGKNWHFYYRALMANRTIPDFQLGLGEFAAQRIEGILNHSFTANGVNYILGDFLTSEKAVAMAHRAHIYGPGYIVGSGARNLPRRLGPIAAAHPTNTQAREIAVRAAIIAATGGDASGHVTQINGWTQLPTVGILGAVFQSVLTDNTLSGAPDSFQFARP